MASETQRTHHFKKALQAAAPHGVYIKHSDRFTIGVPDSTFTDGHTLWLEFKLRPRRGQSMSEVLKTSNRNSRIQMFTLWRLSQASGGRAFYVVHELPRGTSLVRVVNPFREQFETLITDTQDRVVNTLLEFCR